MPWDRNRQSHHITSVVRTTHTDGDVSSGEAAVPSAISRAHSIMRTMQGYEAIHRLHKRQLEGVTKGDVLGQHRVITRMCGWAASRELTTLLSHSHEFLQHNRFLFECPRWSRVTTGILTKR